VEDRKYLIDAAVVRTLKARKTISHTDLFQEVSRILRFPLDNDMLKARIDYLLDAEYMERDGKAENVYHYIA